jgi:hypothetical protein
MFARAKSKNSGLEVIESKKINPDAVPVGSLFGIGRRGHKLVVGVIAPAHIGVIAAQKGSTYTTVEGNYNNGVFSVYRDAGKIDQFIIYGQ